MTSKTANTFLPEVRARAVRMVLDHEAEHPSQWAAISSIAGKIGCTAKTLNEWTKKSEINAGRKPGVTSDMEAKLKALEREDRELRQANEILRKASAYFARGDSSTARSSDEKRSSTFQRQTHGIEPICEVLPIAPSTYHDHAAKRADPRKLSARAQRDVALKGEVRRVFEENLPVYGTRKVWRQLKREGKNVVRCTVARLMKAMGLQGAIRGKPIRTTIPDKAIPCPLDRVNREPHPELVEGQGAVAQRLVGVRFYLCVDVDGLRLRHLATTA